ncbi:inositol polyphosphate 5-phosphatase [Geranomyces variabilis]|nr:inositol polyphosphate 5-phosphatase [Geranomyces variabilis]
MADTPAISPQPDRSHAKGSPPPSPPTGCAACLSLLRTRRRPSRRRVDPQHTADPPISTAPPAENLKRSPDAERAPPEITLTVESSSPVEPDPPPVVVVSPPLPTAAAALAPARAPLPASWTATALTPSGGRQAHEFSSDTAVPMPPRPRPRPAPLPPITRVASTPALAPLLQADPNAPSSTSIRGSHSLRGSLSALFRLGKSSPHLSSTPPPPPPPPPPIPLTVYATTWNLNARAPSCRHLFAQLPRTKHSPHLIAVGTQECESSLEKAVLAQPSAKPRWTAQLCDELSTLTRDDNSDDHAHAATGARPAPSSLPLPAYELIATRTLVGLHLALFARADIVHAVRGVEGAEVAVYMSGAKGAVALACTVMGFSFCFVNAHLRAHEGAVATRNADWNRINDTLPLYGYSAADKRRRAGGISERYDHVFWLGDLNYRTNLGGPQKVEWARSLLEKDEPDIGVFIINDELRRAYHARQVFANYSEPRITFPPTFKLMPGVCSPTAATTAPSTPTTPSPASSTPPSLPPPPTSTLYDRSPKRRTPSYTDRILYRTRIPGGSSNNTSPHRFRRPSNNSTTSSNTSSSARINEDDAHHASCSQLPPGLGQGLNTGIVPVKYGAVQGCGASDHRAVWGLYLCVGVDVGRITGENGDESDEEGAEGEGADAGAGNGGGCTSWWSKKRRRRRRRHRQGAGGKRPGRGKVQPLEDAE